MHKIEENKEAVNFLGTQLKAWLPDRFLLVKPFLFESFWQLWDKQEAHFRFTDLLLNARHL